jgi:hypothetical protein
MDDLVGVNWVGYVRSLSDDDLRELAAWLAAEFLEIGEFMEIVDRAYRQTSDAWRGRSPEFVARMGRLVAQRYARRKRRFAELTVALEEARMTGALRDEVAPEELQVPRLAWREPHTVEELVSVLEHARGGSR